MALAGPRLDRPSAVGDEGRARTVSLWVASAVVVGLTGVAGVVIGQPGLLPTLGTLVGLTVAGIGLVERDRFRLTTVGYVLFLLFGGLLTFQLPLVIARGTYGLAVAALAVALLGIGLAWADVDARTGCGHLAAGVVAAYLTLLSTLGLLGVAAFVALVGREAVAASTAGTAPGAALAWFLATVSYAAVALRVAQWRTPIVQLVPREHRPVAAAKLRRVGWGLLGVAAIAFLGVFGVAIAGVLGVFEALITAAPLLAAALDALGALVVLGVVAGIGTVALLVAVVATLLRVVTRRFGARSSRLAAAAVAGVGLAVLVVLAAATVVAIPTYGSVGNLVRVFVSLVLVPPVLVVVTALGWVVVAAGIVPDRAGGPALAAGALVVAAVGFGRAPTLLVFGSVAGAAVVWDTSWYGLGLTAELGHRPDTRRLELFHAVVAVGLGVVTVGGLYALDVLRTGTGGIGNTTALLFVGVGALLLVAALRG